MKEFLGTFVICTILCVVAVFFFAGLFVENIWAVVVAVSFVLAILITVLMNQDSRIEELEKKIKQLQNEEEPPLGK